MSQRSIEAFLEDAFEALQPTSSTVGRVTVDPVDPTPLLDESQRTGLANELVRCIREKTPKSILTPPGHNIPILDNYPLLKKYLQTITLHGDSGIGSWVQVEPKGDFA